jgi:hypothetical protein
MMRCLKPPNDPMARWDFFRRVARSRNNKWQTVEFSRAVLRELVPKRRMDTQGKNFRSGSGVQVRGFPCESGLGVAWQGMAGPGGARHGRSWQGAARQDKGCFGSGAGILSSAQSPTERWANASRRRRTGQVMSMRSGVWLGTTEPGKAQQGKSYFLEGR